MEELKFTRDFEVIDLGVQECDVYDIEVDETHNFFGNDILVHNSVYYQIEPFVDDYKKEHPNADVNELVDFCMKFEKENSALIIQKTIDDFAEQLNAFNKKSIGAKVEICADAGIFVTKKRYIARVREDEGTRFPIDKPKIKVMGLEIARSSTPIWCQKMLKNAIPILLDKDEKDVKEWLKNVKEEYTKQNIDDISFNFASTSLDYEVDGKGVPIGARACIVYNKYIKDKKLDDKYSEISAGDKIKRLYLALPNKFNSNVVAFNSKSFEKELDCIDYDTNFEKSFIIPLEIMTNALNYNVTKETDTLDDW